jgi:hypothetical protein
MAEFLSGALVSYTQESFAPGYDSHIHGFLRVDLDGGQRLTLLDEDCRLTDHLGLQAGVTHTYIVSPYWTERPQYHALDELPPAVGRFEQHVWWEQALWWGGIVRDLHWHYKGDQSVIVTSLEASKEWWLLETPAGEILYDPSSEDPPVKRRGGELGAFVTWEQIYWFRLLAILPENDEARAR